MMAARAGAQTDRWAGAGRGLLGGKTAPAACSRVSDGVRPTGHPRGLTCSSDFATRRPSEAGTVSGVVAMPIDEYGHKGLPFRITKEEEVAGVRGMGEAGGCLARLHGFQRRAEGARSSRRAGQGLRATHHQAEQKTERV